MTSAADGERASSPAASGGGMPPDQRPRRPRSVLREILIFALFAALAVVMTWPLAIRLSTAVSDLGDPLLNAWILDWTAHALSHEPLRLFSPPVFHPSVYPLAFSEHLAGIAVPVMPFHLAGLSPVTVYNIAMLLGFALSGYGAFVLARMFTPSFAAALAAGIFFAFVPFKFDHLAHLQVVSAGWIPLVLAALVAYWRNATKRNAALVAAAFLMNGLTNVYYLLFVSAALAVSFFFLAVAAPRRDLRFWLRLFGALAIAGLLLLPFMLPYKVVSDLYHFTRPEEEVREGSATWRAWLAPSFRSLLWRDLVPDSWKQHERLLFPGLIAPLLLVVAMFRRSLVRWSVGPSVRGEAETVTAGSGDANPIGVPAHPPATGPTDTRSHGSAVPPTNGPTDQRRFHWLDPIIALAALFSALAIVHERVTWRVAGHLIFAMRGSDVPLMVLAVALMLRLPLRRWIARSRFTVEEWTATAWLITGFVGSFGMNAFFFAFLFRRVFVFESIRASGRFAIIAYAGLAVWAALGVDALRRKRRFLGAACVALMLVDLLPSIRWEHWTGKNPPVYRWLRENGLAPTLEAPVHGWWEAQYLLGNSETRQLSLNGTSGWESPFHFALRMAWENGRHEELFARAENAGAKVFIVHTNWLEQSSIREAIRKALASGRLQFLRRFDHEIDGDFVFAFTKNLPDWRRYRVAEVPDGAGDFPGQAVAKFLAGQPTHNTTAFGQIETPVWDSVTDGPLRVTGWAISPAFIREVWVLIDDGQRRYKAERVARPDVTKRFWWYYEEAPGFAVEIPRRPFGVPRGTDVQVEIVDNQGRRTRLNDVLFYWD